MIDIWALEFVPAKGATLDEMRDDARNSPLFQYGDMRLIWVNEGVLNEMEIAGQARNLDEQS